MNSNYEGVLSTSPQTLFHGNIILGLILQIYLYIYIYSPIYIKLLYSDSISVYKMEISPVIHSINKTKSEIRALYQ